MKKTAYFNKSRFVLYLGVSSVNLPSQLLFRRSKRKWQQLGDRFDLVKKSQTCYIVAMVYQSFSFSQTIIHLLAFPMCFVTLLYRDIFEKICSCSSPVVNAASSIQWPVHKIYKLVRNISFNYFFIVLFTWQWSIWALACIRDRKGFIKAVFFNNWGCFAAAFTAKFQ